MEVLSMCLCASDVLCLCPFARDFGRECCARAGCCISAGGDGAVAGMGIGRGGRSLLRPGKADRHRHHPAIKIEHLRSSPEQGSTVLKTFLNAKHLFLKPLP